MPLEYGIGRDSNLTQPPQLTATLTVERAAKNDVRTRQIVLTLDGEPLATLLFGERITRDISAGRHRLRAHNTLVWKTVEFEVSPAQHVRFVTVNRAGFGSMALVALLGVGPLFVTLERLPENAWSSARPSLRPRAFKSQRASAGSPKLAAHADIAASDGGAAVDTTFALSVRSPPTPLIQAIVPEEKRLVSKEPWI